MKSPRILLVLALSISTLITGAAYAENKEGSRPPGKGDAGRGEKREGNGPITISKVSGESITIGEGAKEKTYKITKSTEITVKGQKAKAEDLKEGMRVNVSMGYDATTAARISASDAPKESAKDGERGKEGARDGERRKEGPRDGEGKGKAGEVKKGDGDGKGKAGDAKKGDGDAKGEKKGDAK